MTYKVPTSKKSKDQNKFDIDIDEVVNGKTQTRHFALPSMKYIKPTVMASVEVMTPTASYQALLEHVAPGLFDLLDDSTQIEDLMGAWRDFSKVSLGESSASSDS